MRTHYAEYYLYRLRVSSSIEKAPRVRGLELPIEKGLAKCSECGEIGILTTQFPQERKNKQCPDCGQLCFSQITPEEFEAIREEIEEDGEDSYFGWG